MAAEAGSFKDQVVAYWFTGFIKDL